MHEDFVWMRSMIHGQHTYVLQHTLAVADGTARAVAQRQYDVSVGYNGEQAVAGFTRATRSPSRSRASAAP